MTPEEYFTTWYPRDMTPREKDVVKLLMYGYSHKEIGSKLGIEECTVKATQRRYSDNLRNKLGMKDGDPLYQGALLFPVWMQFAKEYANMVVDHTMAKEYIS